MKQKKSKKGFYYGKTSVIKFFDQTPKKFTSNYDPLNVEGEKERFLKYGILPRFRWKCSQETLDELADTKRAQIRFDNLDEAKFVIDKVRDKFFNGFSFYEETYGERIGLTEASKIVSQYLKENGIDGQISVGWTKDLVCSAKMCCFGPHLRFNRPEDRHYNLWLKDSRDNNFLREQGIRCLVDHEIGTHFFRMLNDGLQPWFSNRQKFGLRGIRSLELMQTEEGLAAINTLLRANSKYLFSSALLYYTACKSTELNFEELYAHLEHYLLEPDQRWKLVIRVKRGLKNPNDLGGYGRDQCYFAGAVEILRNLDKIDFHLLFSGKVCVDELQRIKRLARLNVLKYPQFVDDEEAYKCKLRQIGVANGLIKPGKVERKKSTRSKTSSRGRSSRSSRQGRPVTRGSSGSQRGSRQQAIQGSQKGGSNASSSCHSPAKQPTSSLPPISSPSPPPQDFRELSLLQNQSDATFRFESSSIESVTESISKIEL